MKFRKRKLVVVVVDRFYIALFSALEQTHCARMHARLPTENENRDNLQRMKTGSLENDNRGSLQRMETGSLERVTTEAAYRKWKQRQPTENGNRQPTENENRQPTENENTGNLQRMKTEEAYRKETER